ncbi:hypothetical protein [Halorussus sp. MSC15.2]|uniref:hypothetical protein n=1 Tax=Halorussus sp. MSC15.2 TaxID=2283638 RepID=UPI0013D20148|nr:hypothetical protein [Halorussus sp. MSC15.2]NEU57111.1 hypothetical protein [Halorussus sp. MSC15.2]
MYKRKSNSGHEIEWEPEDDAIAAQALAEVEETGVVAKSQAEEDAVDIGDDHELAQQVQERYQQLLEQKESTQ